MGEPPGYPKTGAGSVPMGLIGTILQTILLQAQLSVCWAKKRQLGFCVCHLSQSQSVRIYCFGRGGRVMGDEKAASQRPARQDAKATGPDAHKSDLFHISALGRLGGVKQNRIYIFKLIKRL